MCLQQNLLNKIIYIKYDQAEIVIESSSPP